MSQVQRKRRGVIPRFVFGVLAILICAWPARVPAGSLPILPGAIHCPAKIEWHIDSSVQISHFSCDAGDHRGQSVLNYQLEMRNVDKNPHCYRVQIVNQREAAVNGFFPRAGGPAAIYPAEVVKANFQVPVDHSLVDELIVYIRSACP